VYSHLTARSDDNKGPPKLPLIWGYEFITTVAALVSCAVRSRSC